MDPLARYLRQMQYEPIGPEGQRLIGRSTAVVAGCGALGTNLADKLVRAGFGSVRIVDRDVPDTGNLQRQVLFNENDVAQGLTKAKAAVDKLRAINSDIDIKGIHAEITADNAPELIDGADIVLDGLDNIAARYVVNAACVKAGIPWIYGAVAGSTGMCMPILPGRGPCLNCLFPGIPPDADLPTANTHGILNTAPAAVSALQVTMAIKIVTGHELYPEDRSGFFQIDLWHGIMDQVMVSRDPQCEVCSPGNKGA